MNIAKKWNSFWLRYYIDKTDKYIEKTKKKFKNLGISADIKVQMSIKVDNEQLNKYNNKGEN